MEFMISTHKIFFDYSQTTFTRGDKYKIFMKRCNTSLRQNSFIHRTVTLWNSLKFQSKNADTVDGFKNAVDRELNDMMYDYDT